MTNIASSCTRHTRTILGAAPQLVSCLSAPNPALQEQALWTLGNIAGDNDDFRQMLHANGALRPILRLLQHPPVCFVLSLLEACDPCTACVLRLHPQQQFRVRVEGLRLEKTANQRGPSVYIAVLAAAPSSIGSWSVCVEGARRTIPVLQPLCTHAYDYWSTSCLTPLIRSPPLPFPRSNSKVNRNRANSGVGGLQPRAWRSDPWKTFLRCGADLRGVLEGRRLVL